MSVTNQKRKITSTDAANNATQPHKKRANGIKGITTEDKANDVLRDLVLSSLSKGGISAAESRIVFAHTGIYATTDAARGMQLFAWVGKEGAGIRVSSAAHRKVLEQHGCGLVAGQHKAAAAKNPYMFIPQETIANPEKIVALCRASLSAVPEKKKQEKKSSTTKQKAVKMVVPKKKAKEKKVQAKKRNVGAKKKTAKK